MTGTDSMASPPLPAIMTYFEDLSLEHSALPRVWNIAPSESKDTPVVILEASTGRRIPYWAELDHNSDDPTTGGQQNRTLMIWPAFRLEDGERYIVAMRGLKNSENELVEPSPGFAALRDNATTDDPAIEGRRDYFGLHIFSVLSDHGVEHSELQIAWDFTVMSTKQITTRMLNMRDDALSRIEWKHGGVRYRLESITDDLNDHTARRIEGSLFVPWYLNKLLPGPRVRIETQWDNHLMPVYQGHQPVYFEMVIPHSVANGTKGPRLMQYGHGLFEGIFEIDINLTQPLWDEWGFVVGGVNWLGMCSEDLETIVNIVASNLTNFVAIPERLHQGVLNALYYQHLLRSPAFLKDERIWVFDGKSSVLPDPAPQAHYWGISLGGIMGSVFMSLSTNITHGVCNAPGFPFELILPRSSDFESFRQVLVQRYQNNLDIVLIYAFAQMVFTPITPSGYLHHMARDPLPGTPKHSVLIQYGLGDWEVSWLGAQQMGRSLDAVMYESNVAEYNESVYSAHFIKDDVTINTFEDPGHVMIQGWNFDEPEMPFVNLPPNEGDNVHRWTSLQHEAQAATIKFYDEGIIENVCGGACQGTKPMSANVTHDPRSWHEQQKKVGEYARKYVY